MDPSLPLPPAALLYYFSFNMFGDLVIIMGKGVTSEVLYEVDRADYEGAGMLQVKSNK